MKIMIVDDHVLFREGLASMMKAEPDFEVVGLVGTVQEAIKTARVAAPDVILMDFGLPDGNGVEATRAILVENPGCKIVFLTVSDEDQNLFSAIRAGAKGYLIKNMYPSKLISAIRSVLCGEGALSRTMTARLMEELARSKEPEFEKNSLLATLTDRELDVLRSLSSGLSNQEIASNLTLAENTVKYHVHSILGKLDLPDRRSAARYATEHGLKRIE